MEDIIGIIAAILTTSSFIPQALKTIRTRDTKALSLKMYVMFNMGVFTWLIYGITIQSIPVILANAFTLILTAIILYFKWNEKKSD